MNRLKIIKNNLIYYRHATIGAGLGCILTAMIITGTLLVGDSARNTLHNMAIARIGDTGLLLNSGGRFFADSLSARLENKLSTPSSSALMLKGIAFAPATSSIQANNVQITGIDKSFNDFSAGVDITLQNGEIAINDRLADYLSVKEGDNLSVRIEKPGILPRDAPLSSRAEAPYARGLYRIVSVLSDKGIGRFSPKADQTPPFNIFINIGELQEKVELHHKANLLLVKHSENNLISSSDADIALQEVSRPSDFGISINHREQLRIIQVESEEVFLNPSFSSLLDIDSAGAMTYMVNAISTTSKNASRSTPYSFVTAVSRSNDRAISPVPPEMMDNQMIINRWLANQLKVSKGDILNMTYFILDPANQLIEDHKNMEVFDVIEMSDVESEHLLAPEFPGLSDVETCENWNVGLPMDEDLLKDEANEEYWNTYKDTPKAFITLAAGQKLWGNRFGNLTAVRFPEETYSIESVTALVKRKLSPDKLGFFFNPAREQALTSAKTSMDLGELFGGMSFFLIVAALTFTALLFSFSVDQRSKEIGTLLTVGFLPRQVKNLFLAEAAIISLGGSIIGSFMGTYFTRFLLWGLAEQWGDAVANSPIDYYSTPISLCKGTAIAFVVVIAAIYSSTRSKLRRQVHELMTSTPSKLGVSAVFLHNQRLSALLYQGSLLLAGMLMVYAIVSRNSAVSIFYIAGTLLLTSGISFTWYLLTKYDSTASLISRRNISIKNAAWRSGRSLAVTGILACGVFSVCSIFAMKQDTSKNADKSYSGTGGFELFAETSLPVFEHDLSSSTFTEDALISCIKVKEGDDASCFNLNRSLSPTILGVDYRKLSEIKAFTPLNGKNDPWMLLNQTFPDGSIPVLAGDANTAMWGLEMKIGDSLSVRNDYGQEIQLKLVGQLPMKLSVFQGNVLISQEHFTQLFPTKSGYNMLLLDLPSGEAEAAATSLKANFSRLGINITTTTERLSSFYSVESAYLSMFLSLGGLGLLLATAGLGVIITRNTMERKNELALMRCVGFSALQVKVTAAAEYIFLITAGMICGVVASLAALYPNLMTASVEVPWITMLWLVLSIFTAGILFTLLAVTLAMSAPTLSSLRRE